MIGRVLGFLVWLALFVYVKVGRKNHATFRDPETDEAYLTRWTLGPNAEWPDAQGRTGGAGWYLHFFHRSDWSRNLHNHPCEYAVAWVLRGGYRETRRERKEGVTFETTKLPGYLNVITSDTFHRVTLLGMRGSWSLFYIGPRSGRGWGFVQDDGSVERAAHHDGRTGKVTARDI